MDYLSRLNDALEYLETHLEESIDYQKICKIACMSKSTFQRTFLFVSNMTLSDYIRNRKMKAASEELISTDQKIIDIASKYGYESAAAFSRAFKNFCDMTPSQVRENGTSIDFPIIRFELCMKEGEMNMNEKTIVRLEEHIAEKVICFDVDCVDPETEAWNEVASFCRKYVPDRTARRFVGYAPLGHHPGGESHENAEEHVKHPYCAQMYLIGEECQLDHFHGKEVIDAPKGLFLVNDVSLNQYDDHGNLDIALSMMKASDAFIEFVKRTPGYEFDCEKGIFYEEHVFSEKWFQTGGLMDGFKMWVPIKKVVCS